MSSLRTFSIGTTMKILLPSVTTFLLAFPVLAQNDSSNYVFLLASGFLCDPGDSSTCPARAKANQGDSYELSGAGTFNAQNRSGPLPTFGEALSRHNIELTQSALIDALENPDPEVRHLAAAKLAEDGATEAIPAIKQALGSEKVPWTRMNIAFALAQMGESIGFDTLEDNCRNNKTSGSIRAGSAEYLLRFKRDSTTCLSGVLDVLKSGSNGDRMVAAALLPRYHNLSVEDSEKVFAALVEALLASHPSVRMAAGRALADLGDALGVAELQLAVVREQEEVVRWQMQEDLKILTKKTRQ